jgi:hypothetical protein
LLFAYICIDFGFNSKEQVQKKLFQIIFLFSILLFSSLKGFAAQSDFPQNSADHQCSILSDDNSNSEKSIPDFPLELAEKPDQKEESKTGFEKDLTVLSSLSFFYFNLSKGSGCKTCDCSYFQVRFIPLYRLFHSWKHFV